jgi:rubrerythrin
MTKQEILDEFNDINYVYNNSSKHETLSRMLDELLKEQEAVPVIQREIMHLLIWCCGSCGVAITDGDKFCRMCGKKLKWK